MYVKGTAFHEIPFIKKDACNLWMIFEGVALWGLYLLLDISKAFMGYILEI